MKKVIFSFLAGLILSINVSLAKTQFITDEFNIMLRVAPSIGSKIIKPLPTGTPLTVIITDAGKAHSQVRTKDGLVGYVLTRFISQNEPAKIRLSRLDEQLKSLQESPRTMVDNKEAAETRYAQLKTASGNTAVLSEKASELETKVEQLVLQLDDMRIQNETLKDNSEKKSWVIGGSIMLFGVLFGAVLVVLSSRRKRSW